MGRIAIAVKHMLACGASHEAVVAVIDEFERADDEAAQARREFSRKRQQEHRARLKSVTPVTPVTPVTVTKEKVSHTLPKENYNPLDLPKTVNLSPKPENQFFDEFWLVYPRKVAKGSAKKAYRNALKRAAPAEILAGVRRYAASKPEPEFTAHAASWLNADRWLDEYKDSSNAKQHVYIVSNHPGKIAESGGSNEAHGRYSISTDGLGRIKLDAVNRPGEP